jgi:acetate kinase
MEERAMRILTINSGSSSVKIALYQIGETESLEFSGSLERIGLRSGAFHIRDAEGQSLIDEQLDLPDHEAAFKRLFDWLHDSHPGKALDAAGHRVVHGGARFTLPQRITPALIAELKELVHLAPEHLPHEIKAILATTRAFPDLAQAACFDTAFHSSMPRLARIYALPRYFMEMGLMRYGFHGLSYEYIVQELRREAGARAADGRLIIAHLGNGASMAAVQDGRSVETTMGFTPAGGLVMSTRSGDLDPGALIYLLEEKGLKASDLNYLVNRRSGLLAVSGLSSDMRDLLAQEDQEPQARLAVDLFCYSAGKHLGALAAVLGGLETLVFTAGIGENAPAIRQRICGRLGYMGVQIDPTRNEAGAAIISPDGAPVTVRVMHTDEDLMIARHTYALIREEKNRRD